MPDLTAIPGGAGAPPEPDWTSIYADEFDLRDAHEHWRTISREMDEAGTLAVANGYAMQRLVQFHIVFLRASKDVAEKGSVMKAKRSRVPQYNPHWAVMKQSDEAIRSLEAELGLTPLRRDRAGKVQRAKKASRAADAYLRPVAKSA